MAKRKEREFDHEDEGDSGTPASPDVSSSLDVSEVCKSSPKATIRGIVASLSPMKKSKSTGSQYFDGEITDGKSSMRVFGFNAEVRRKLAGFEGKNAVAIGNCEVRKCRGGEELEVFVTKGIDVVECDKKFEVEPVAVKRIGREITLSKVQNIAQFQRVTVDVKVLSVDTPVEVSGGKTKQDTVVADKTGTSRFTIWQGEIGKLEVGESYRLIGAMVKMYKDRKFLSTAMENSSFEGIPDIGDVCKATGKETMTVDVASPLRSRVRNVRVMGVLHFETYSGCLKCKAKIVPDENDPELGCCPKCKMIQCIETTCGGLSVQLMVKGDGEKLTLRAFGKVVEEIAQKAAGEVTMGSLLKCKAFNMVHMDGIIQSVSRSVEA